MKQKLYYFGCVRECGHFLFESEHHKVWNSKSGFISERLRYALDGAFCPPIGTPDQRYLISNVPPWIILSWWDRSVDKRPNSCSALIYSGRATPHEIINLASVEFPNVISRQQPLIPYVPLLEQIDK